MKCGSKFIYVGFIENDSTIPIIQVTDESVYPSIFKKEREMEDPASQQEKERKKRFKP